MPTKNDVLRLLEENKGEPISGQKLAELLGVSRQAIWKAVESLKEDGHIINSSINKGYQLDSNSDLISAEGIRIFLSKENRDRPIIVFKTIDSTNSEAKRLALNGALHGTVIIAEEQTNGRGRKGKSFFSPPKTGIYASFILKPKVNIDDAQMVTIYAAVSVCNVIENLTNLKPKIKWVNDIYLNGKKICGILTEAISDFESGTVDFIIVGIGVNFSTKQEDFPKEIQDIAGSLPKTNISRNQFIAALIDEMLKNANCIFQNNLIDLYKEHSLMLGKEIIYQKNLQTLYGKVLDINERGNLVVLINNSKIDILHSGEVEIKTKRII